MRRGREEEREVKGKEEENRRIEEGKKIVRLGVPSRDLTSSILEEREQLDLVARLDLQLSRRD